jgi:protein-disulfide isomerase
MHDQIFVNQDRWNGEATSHPRNVLAELAKGLGLNMTKYNACMDAETYRPQVTANQQEGLRRQVGQTPSFIIGGKLIPGAIPYDEFKKLVDDAAKLAPAPASAPAATPAGTGKKGA